MRDCCGGPKYVRSLSAPKIMIPSEVMGEYEDPEERTRRRSAPLPLRPPGGGLFPLLEEGTYGPPPSLQTSYKRRERKPKVYASYAVSSDCNVHAEKLENNEKSQLSGSTKSNRRKSAPATPRTRSSPARSSSSMSTVSSQAWRSKSARRSSSLSPERPQSRLSFTSDTSGYESTLTYESTQYITAPAEKRKLGSRVNSKKMLQFPEAVSEEEEYSGMGVESGIWDSMGVLGLSSKLFSETKTKQENFLKDSFARKISVSTHVC